MPGSPLDRHRSSPAEIIERLELDRLGLPYVVLRGGDDRQVILQLEPSRQVMVIGRSPSADVALPWDRGVSRRHAELRLFGDEWVIADHGLSTNGTFVNDQRVAGQRRLRDGDRIRVGSTAIAYRVPEPVTVDGEERGTTWKLDDPPPLSTAQRRV